LEGRRIVVDFAELESELAVLVREADGVIGFHGPYGPRPPLPEAELNEFEKTNGVVLPEEYREFLLRFGNGGRWPVLMQPPFEGGGPNAWRSWDIRPGAISEPFPHTYGWNDPSGEPVYSEELDGDPEFERQEREWQHRYFSPALLNGAIPLQDNGCARYTWLVVTGPLVGGVWFDSRVDRLGFYPITNCDGLQVQFLDWMLLRVDYARRWVRRVKKRAEQNCFS
jgi:hypothetical protein